MELPFESRIPNVTVSGTDGNPRRPARRPLSSFREHSGLGDMPRRVEGLQVGTTDVASAWNESTIVAVSWKWLRRRRPAPASWQRGLQRVALLHIQVRRVDEPCTLPSGGRMGCPCCKGVMPRG